MKLYNLLFSLTLPTLLMSYITNSNAEGLCPTTLKTPYTGDKAGCFDKWIGEMISNAGCSVEFVDIKAPFSRKLKMLENGELDFMFGLSKSPEREGKMKFSIPLATQHTIIIYHQNSSARGIKDWCDDNMKKSTVLLQEGLTITNKFIESSSHCVQGIEKGAVGLARQLLMLQKERADFILTDNEFWNTGTKSRPELFTGLHKHDLQIWETQFHIALGNQHSNKLLEAINNSALSKTQNDDTICGYDTIKQHQKNTN